MRWTTREIFADPNSLLRKASFESNPSDETPQAGVVNNGEIPVLELNSFLRANLKKVQNLVGEHIRVILRLASPCTAISNESGCLEQLLANLVIHSRESITKKGRLMFETGTIILGSSRSASLASPDGPHVFLVVRDNGMGMSLEVCTLFFQSLFVSRQEIRSGEGWIYARGTFEGGGIEVQSRAGSGTLFKVFFPMAFRSNAEVD